MASSEADLRFQFCLLISLTAIIASFQIVNPLPFHLTLVSLGTRMWLECSSSVLSSVVVEGRHQRPATTAWALRLCGVVIYSLTFSTLFIALIINEPSDYLSLTRK